jgi:tRNA dimethylallyltransferase
MTDAAAQNSRVVVVLGPTASGKSALGIDLALRLGGEILVCDSTQVFRHFDIGTAKVAEQRGIPHHLTDLAEPAELFTAGEYRRRARAALEDVTRCGRLPILTAGTGLYLRALLDGLADAPERSEELRDRLRQSAARRSAGHLHRILVRLDPEAAGRIAPRDTQKVIRAVEIRLLSRKTVGDVHRSGREALRGYKVIKIGLLPDRQALYARIEQRTRAMIAAGWLEEVRALSAAFPPDVKPFQFIGYSALREHLAGKLSLEEAIRRIQQATRQFAKRQITWFRRESDVHWLNGFGDEPEIVEKSLHILRDTAASAENTFGTRKTILD